MKRELIVSTDGSHTIIIPELGESYHSKHGAIQESQHVFIKNGFFHFTTKQEGINILEIGFGTGLNAFLTVLKRGNLKIHYTTLEPHPLSEDLIQQLNYPDMLGNERLFCQIHESPWNQEVEINKGFRLLKLKQRLEDFFTEEKFDLIYFDAFAPHAQPELWEIQVFAKLYRIMKPQGVLVTYCAKGSVKRALKQKGFQVEAIPGPPGKREMTRAVKMQEDRNKK